MPRFLVRVAVSAGICISFVAAVSAAEQEISPWPRPSAGQARILAALDQTTEFDFRERLLSDVINDFKEKHKIEIDLDRKALNEAGVGTDTPMTETLKNITLRSALRLLLMRLDLTYVVGDGYLLITSKSQAEEKLSTKIYPVRDLVTLGSEFRPAPPPNDVSSFPGLVQAFPGIRPAPGKTDDFTGLIDLITSSVSPTTWDEVGGPGSIQPNGNAQAIAVSQTDEVHDQIVALLAALRLVRDEQITAAKPLDPAAASEAAESKTTLQVHAYRLMRGPKSPGKSGWRPPVGVVGDESPPRDAQGKVKKAEAPPVPSGAQGGAAKEIPDKDSAAAKETAPVKDAARVAGGADSAPLAKPTDHKLEAWAEKIAKMVPEMIEPGSWEPSGEGMIRAVGEAVVVRHTEEVQHRVARLMAELVPDYVPVDGVIGPWGPWMAALVQARQAAMPRLRPATTANWPQQAEPRACGAEARIQEALLEKCDLEFDQLPLLDALNRLAEGRQVQLYIDNKALSDAGVRDALVTHSVKGLNFATALTLLLDEIELTYLIRDEVVLITSKTEAENLLTIKVYPVFDLVLRPPDAPVNRPAVDFTSLIDNITTNIAPVTWDEVGGPGSIQPFTNAAALVIAQTPEIHEFIAEYLRALREAGAALKQDRAAANR
jgi:hypothetical protein